MSRRVISARDVEELLKRGGDTSTLPADAIYTPSARDMLRERPLPASMNAPKPPAKSAPAALDEKLLHAPHVRALAEHLCEIGRRMWQREYVDGNGGNISVRIDDKRVLCTPTRVSKGFMRPDDLCLVDLDGNQLAGTRPRTSEILMHLEIFKVQPKAKACVHGHPATATGFAAAGVKPPNRVLSEFELFVGEIGMAPYLTPGTREIARAVGDLARDHNTILLANHGAVAWGEDLDDAYFRMEILETYCKSLVVAMQLGTGPKRLGGHDMKQLLGVKERLGIPDRRAAMKEAELNDTPEWRPPCIGGGGCGGRCSCHGNSNPSAGDEEAEQLVHVITDMIMAQLRT